MRAKRCGPRVLADFGADRLSSHRLALRDPDIGRAQSSEAIAHLVSNSSWMSVSPAAPSVADVRDWSRGLRLLKFAGLPLLGVALVPNVDREPVLRIRRPPQSLLRPSPPRLPLK